VEFTSTRRGTENYEEQTFVTITPFGESDSFSDPLLQEITGSTDVHLTTVSRSLGHDFNLKALNMRKPLA